MRYRRPGMVATLAVSLALALGFAACGGGDDDDSDSNGERVDASDGSITIVMKDNLFEPKDIAVPVNTEVEITVENEGTVVHNMHVLSKDKEGTDFSSDALVNPASSSTFTVKFTTTGTFDFLCDYHLPDMAGTIKVE